MNEGTHPASRGEAAVVDEALRHLDAFCAGSLTGMLRRSAVWKRLPARLARDWRDDVRQELSLDCVQHAPLICGLATRDRERRWMRRAERWIYRNHSRRPRLESLAFDPAGRSEGEPNERPTRAAHPDTAAVAADPPAIPHIVQLGNGRLHLRQTAHANRRSVQRMRHTLEALAVSLGRDNEYLAFWKNRVAEALASLAAGLLRERGCTVLLPRRRRPTNLRRRLRRVRRLAQRFHISARTRAVRCVLRPWLRGPVDGADAPQRLLEASLQLRPDAPGPWLWLFEANLAARDLAGAARALRRLRELRPHAPAGHERAGIVLARARLLEARGRFAAGVHLLRRALRRWPRLPAVERALALAERSPSGVEGRGE
jgi:hypothetical protein